jgi:puromycin-sensitive aminopeptidase
VLSAYATEDDATVWGMMLEQLHSLHSLLTGAPELLAPFDTFARSMLLGKLSELGWTPRSTDGHLTRKLRGELIGVLPALCASDQSVVAEARRRFGLFVTDPAGAKDELPSEYQQAVYKIVLKAGGRAEFDALMHLFQTLPLNEQKKAALAALGSAPSPELRNEALEFAISGNVKLQDFFYVSLSMHGSGPDGLEATWTFFMANVERYSEMLAKASPSLMDAVITGACRGFATADKAAEVRAFFQGHPMARNERKIAQVLEGIETNAKYLTFFKASGALAWLNAYTPEA